MANVTAIQILQDGPRNVVVKLTGILDTADITATALLTPATLSAIGEREGLATKLIIDKISYNIESPLVVNLYWTATTPILIASLANGGDDLEFDKFGGVYNGTPAAAGATGAIEYTTQGWSVGTILSFNVILECRKSV
jgi:hypothetical protein